MFGLAQLSLLFIILIYLNVIIEPTRPSSVRVGPGLAIIQVNHVFQNLSFNIPRFITWLTIIVDDNSDPPWHGPGFSFTIRTTFTTQSPQSPSSSSSSGDCPDNSHHSHLLDLPLQPEDGGLVFWLCSI